MEEFLAEFDFCGDKVQDRFTPGGPSAFLLDLCPGFLFLLFGCAHYPLNHSVRNIGPQGGYRGRDLADPGNDDELLPLLTFSGGGTRAAAFSYGVLETLRDTTVSIRGRHRRLLDVENVDKRIECAF
jgi:hypothetical protein